MLFSKAKYSTWVPTNAYSDTGERSGFLQSVLEGAGGRESRVDTELDEPESDAFGEAVPLPELTQSAAALASMQRVQVPAMPVSTAYGRDKFDDMWMAYARADGSQSFLDVDAFAIDWNKAVSAIDDEESPASVFWKTAASLRAYWKKSERINVPFVFLASHSVSFRRCFRKRIISVVFGASH